MAGHPLAKIAAGSRRRPKAGEVFRLRLREGPDLFGLVFDGNSYWATDRRGCNLVGVHVPAVGLDWRDLRFSRDSLITATVATNADGWRDGFFETVGHRELLPEEVQAPSSVCHFANRRIEVRDPRDWSLRLDDPLIVGFFFGVEAIGLTLTRVLTGAQQWGDHRRLMPDPERPGVYLYAPGGEPAGRLSPKHGVNRPGIGEGS